MSVLSKDLGINRAGIQRLDIPEDAKEWLEEFCDNLEEKYRKIYDFAEAGGMQTKLWRISETGTTLLVQRKESGAWVTKWTFTAS
jgi:hypothetical protein